MECIQGKFKTRGIKVPGDNPKHKILSISDIIKEEIGKLVNKSMEIFGDDASPQDCERLLYEFKYDYDRMLEKFFEADSFVDFRNNYKSVSLGLPPQMMIDSFIQANPLYKWCPNKRNGCKKAVKIDSSDVEEIICECGTEFCFKCLAPPHSPFPCVLLHEWIIQRDEFEVILKSNDLICRNCYQVYKDDQREQEFWCYCCDSMFLKDNARLTRQAYPDYSNYRFVLAYFNEVKAKKDALIGVKDVEFITVVYKIAQSFLQQLLPLHAFSFYLDKEYLCKNPVTDNTVSMFVLHQEKLNPLFEELISWIERTTEVSDVSINDEEQNKILNILHELQQRMDILFKFIKESAWIFKLPEIQQAYPDPINDDEEPVDDYNGEDSIAEDIDDDEEEEEGMDEDGDSDFQNIIEKDLPEDYDISV